MKLKPIVCTSCGAHASINLDKKIGYCESCGNTFVVEHAAQLATVEVDKTKELKNMRQLLDKAIQNDDFDAILNFSSSIQAIIPSDFRATYFYAYANKNKHNPKYLNQFYTQYIITATPKELNVVLDHIIHNSDLRDYKQVKNYLNYVDQQALETYEQVFEKRKHKEDDYSFIPRDVFVCHRSTDSTIAQKAVEVIERDGNHAWISYRNLRPNDNDNYWKNIREAIESCTVFLVISSEEAMLSKDVQREIDIATKLNKPRLELKIDASVHTSLFKYFFDGIKWIDAYVDFEVGLKQLRARFFDLKKRIKEDEQKNESTSETQEKGKVHNILIRAEVEIEHKNFSQALNYIEKVLDEDAESSQAWWLKFLANHSYEGTQTFESHISEQDHIESLIEALKDRDFQTARKFATDTSRYDRYQTMLETMIQREIAVIKKDKNKTRLNSLYSDFPEHKDLGWLHFLFENELYDTRVLEERIRKEEYLLENESLFESDLYRTFLEAVDNKGIYAQYETKFNTFIDEIGDERVEQIRKNAKKLSVIKRKIELLLEKKKWKAVKRSAKKLVNLHVDGEPLKLYYLILSKHQFASFDVMLEAFMNPEKVDDHQKIVQSKLYQKFLDQEYFIEEQEKLEAALSNAKKIAKEKLEQHKREVRQKKYRRWVAWTNLVFLISNGFIFYLALHQGFPLEVYQLILIIMVAFLLWMSFYRERLVPRMNPDGIYGVLYYPKRLIAYIILGGISYIILDLVYSIPGIDYHLISVIYSVMLGIIYVRYIKRDQKRFSHRFKPSVFSMIIIPIVALVMYLSTII